MKRGLLCPKRRKETALKEKQTVQRTNGLRMLNIQTCWPWGKLALGCLSSHKGSNGGVGRLPTGICPYKAICREGRVEGEEEAEVVIGDRFKSLAQKAAPSMIPFTQCSERGKTTEKEIRSVVASSCKGVRGDFLE